MKSKGLSWVLAGILLLCLGIIVVSVNAVSPILGEKIAFSSNRDTHSNLQIYVMNVDGTSPVRLTYGNGNDRQPTWSPDRLQIAFVSDRDGNDEIYVMNADGSNPTRLTNNPAIDYNPAWSPDGTKLAFASTRGGNWDIYVMGMMGMSSLQQLTTDPAIDATPAWSPDGTKIAFASERNGGIHDIFEMNADGSNQVDLTNDPMLDAAPAWSPDGTKIAFYSDRVGNGNNEIYMMDADGSNQVRLTNNPADDSVPKWSPEGMIVFDSTRDGNVEIYVMNVNDPANPILTRLTNNQWVDGNPEFTPIPVLVADFIYSRAASPPNTIDFTDTSFGTPVSWGWIFDDAALIDQTDPHPSYTFTTPGIHTVTLIVTDSDGVRSSITKDVSTIPGIFIEKGATIFVGEGGLDITHALSSAYGNADPNDPYPHAYPGLPPKIAYWTWPPNPLNFAPDIYIDLSGRTNSFTVTQGEFATRTSQPSGPGRWYAIVVQHDDPRALQGSDWMNAVVAGGQIFSVTDPSLAIKTIDLNTGTDVSDKTVTRDTRLGFEIVTNMYPAVDPNYRSPINPDTDGFIDIKVKNPDGTVFTTLYNGNVGSSGAGPYPIVNNFVDGQPWTWGSADYGWQTGALDVNSQPVYNPGVYEVSAESTLHHMKDNYNVVGKSVSASHAVTIINGGGGGLTVTGITPASGFNTGSVSITDLAGTGFVSGASVKLTRAGQADIIATGVTVVSATQITCTLPIAGKAAGLWNVVVTNPDLTTGTLPSGFSITTPQMQNDAYTYLLQSEFPGGTLPSGTAMSVSDTQLPPKSKVHQWGGLSEPRFYVTGNHWFWSFTFDPTPKSNFEHRVKHFFVNKADLAIEEYDAQTPLSGIMTRVIGGTVQVSGTSTVSGTMASSAPNSLLVGGPFLTGATVGAGVMSVTPSCSNLDCGHCYALLISGGVEPARNYARYWTDMSDMYMNLTKYPYCYPEDHIYVLMSDGTVSGTSGQDQCANTNCASYISSSPDLDFDLSNELHYDAATVSNLVSTFATLRGLLNADPQSTLFIFTTNHGGNNTIPGSGEARLYLWGTDQFIWDHDFVNNLSTMNSKATTITMEQCYSGGFIDDFASYTYAGTQKRVISTAATGDQSSHGNDFSAAWIAGMSGAANLPVNNGNGDTLISYAEDFYYARAHDLSALGSSPLENPQTSGGSRKDNLTMGIGSCSLCTGVGAIPGVTPSVTPRDLTSPADGLYEDVNGNGAWNKADAAFFFTNLESIAAGEPTCAFDFNANGKIDFADIVRLYTISPS